MRYNPNELKLSAVVFAAIGGIITMNAESVIAATIPAQPAHSFVNSVGLNTSFGCHDFPYRSRYAEVKAKLVELGIRHIRDIVSGPSAASIFVDLYSTIGVRLLPIVDVCFGAGQRLDPSRIKRRIDFIRKVGTAPLDGVEGPNEANLTEKYGGYKGWPTDLRRFQETLYRTVRADPAFVGKKVIQPSIAGPNSHLYYARMGNYSRIADVGNLHPYSNWLPWEVGAATFYDNAQNTMPGRPFWVTETGWHTDNKPQSLDMLTVLRYFPRALVAFSSFRNIKRGYIYQLADTGFDSNSIHEYFGLLDHKGNVKPGFYAVRNMMHILCDDPLRSAPGSLKYSLSGKLADVRTVLYQKNNGAFYLAIWLEKRGKVGLSCCESRDVINPPQAVTIKFEQGISLVRRYEPADPGGDVTIANDAKQRYSNPRSLDISVRDSITILEIVPAGVVTPATKKSCTFKATAS